MVPTGANGGGRQFQPLSTMPAGVVKIEYGNGAGKGFYHAELDRCEKLHTVSLTCASFSRKAIINQDRLGTSTRKKSKTQLKKKVFSPLLFLQISAVDDVRRRKRLLNMQRSDR